MKYEVNEASPRHKETLHIINLVSKALGIGMKTLTGKSRQRHIVDARRVCYALLQEKMQLPAIHIGAYFGKDHANIRHHQKEHPLLYRVYPDYKLMYDKAEKVVNANEYVEHDIYECVNNMLLRIEMLEKDLNNGFYIKTTMDGGTYIVLEKKITEYQHRNTSEVRLVPPSIWANKEIENE